MVVCDWIEDAFELPDLPCPTSLKYEAARRARHGIARASSRQRQAAEKLRCGGDGSLLSHCGRRDIRRVRIARRPATP